MRRISLALALTCAMAATGCGGGASSSSSSGNKGTVGKTFTVTIQNGQSGNASLAIVGGKVTSSPAGIDCGVGTTQACSFDFDVNTPVVLTATPVGTDTSVNLPYLFLGWAGDCAGETTCTLSGNSSKYVLAIFGGTRTGHPNFTDSKLHAPAAMSGVLQCTSCHGANLQGQGLAVACTNCHSAAEAAAILALLPAPPAPAAASTGLKLAVTSATLDATNVATVTFTVKDDQNNPIDLTTALTGTAKNVAAAPYDVTPVVMDGTLRFSLSRIDFAADGQVLPYAVLTGSTTPGTVTIPKVGVAPGTSGALVQNAAGSYTYTTATLSKVDATKLSSTHTIWIQASRQTNTTNAFDPKGFKAVNVEYNFVPAGGTATKREVVTTAACNKCHDGFQAEDGGLDNTKTPPAPAWKSFHGGGRIDGKYCDVCHNPGDAAKPYKDAAVFVHRIHASEQMPIQAANLFHGIQIGYPQDIRNCSQCHGDAQQGAQWQTRPNRQACGSCHDTTDFTTLTPVAPMVAHGGGVQVDDTLCAGCHSPSVIAGDHVAVAPTDPNNVLSGGTNSNTNAASLAAAGAVPAGATRITYEIGSVAAVADAGSVLRPTITFRFLKDGTPAPMDMVCGPATVAGEIFNNFVGSPSVYFVWSVAQDGIAAPADFNASASAYVKRVCNGAAASSTTISGPDASQFYTVTITNVVIPASAKMLTGGVGYTYGLNANPASDTAPLTQTNLAAYPYNASTRVGGLIVAAPDVNKVATGYTGRRVLVDNAKCNACHAQLGAAPTFHAGQRNDAPTCSWCHTPNRTSSAWSANASTFIHGIHGAGKRSVGFNWHAACPPGSTFAAVAGTNSGTCNDNVTGLPVTPKPYYLNVEYPGHLADCQQCHVAGGYDFSSASVPSLLWSTVATGTNAAATISLSPYVTIGTAYGSGFSVANATGVSTQAAATTLVSSPIAAACFSCHDTAANQAHMQSFGGHIYEARSTAQAAGTATEKCLDCHGSGAVGISNVHK